MAEWTLKWTQDDGLTTGTLYERWATKAEITEAEKGWTFQDRRNGRHSYTNHVENTDTRSVVLEVFPRQRRQKYPTITKYIVEYSERAA